MLRLSRTNLAGAALCLVALGITAADPPDPYQSQKAAAVRTALDKQGRPDAGSSLVQSARHAAALLEFRVEVSAGQTRLILDMHGEPAYEAFDLDDGKRIVIDLQDTVNLKSGASLEAPNSPVLAGVRTSLFSLEPRFVSRVVLDMTEPCTPEIRREDGRLTVALSPKGSALPARQSSNQIAAAEREQEDTAPVEKTSPADERPAFVTERPTASIASMDTREESAEDSAAAGLERAAELLLAGRDATAEPQRTAPLAGSARGSVSAEIRAPALPEGALEAMVARAESEQDLNSVFSNMRDIFSTLDSPRAEAAVDGGIQVLPEETAEQDLAPMESEDLGEAPDFAATIAPQQDVSHLQQLAAALAQAAQAAQTAQSAVDSEPSEAGLDEEIDLEAGSVEEPAQEATPVEPAPSMPEAVISLTPRGASTGPAGARATAQQAIQSRNSYSGDPLYQPVTIDFREMELTNVVQLLAEKGQVNVIAGEDVSLRAPVTANVKNIPLIQAMEVVLRINNLGLVEEEGIFRIVPYDEAVLARRATEMVFLQNADAEDVAATLNTILATTDAIHTSIAANRTTNVVIISGPERRVAELRRIVAELDIAEPVIPTVTQAIKLNYAEPEDAVRLIGPLLTPDVGKAEGDARGRFVIVTDMPMIIEQISELIAQVDTPVKQVVIEAMIADVVLRDASQTGVNWLLDLVRQRDSAGNPVGILDSRRNTRGQIIGSMQDLNLGGNLGNIGADNLNAGILSLGVLSNRIDFRALIAAETGSRNAEILASPVIRTVENKQAMINITQEFPYQEITQGLTGPPVASTEFKDIGVTLNVTPRVTHEDTIIVDVAAKQSSVSGLTETGVPIEDKREASSTLSMPNGSTIFIGGLRNYSDRLEVSKIPLLGDIPVINFMFRNTDVEKINTGTADLPDLPCIEGRSAHPDRGSASILRQAGGHGPHTRRPAGDVPLHGTAAGNA
jgi:general secretion pathway protein D